MKKFFASLLVFLTIFGSVFAHGGLMSGEEDLRVTKTKWFDIIYPARSEKSAILLYENADRIYEEIGESYGFPPKFRLPVVICPGVEQFNGYMSNGYYNHIVLYDTAMIEDLAVFTDTFLNLFKHECIHAYTFNLKNKFWTVASKVLGDALSPDILILTSGLAEGATVSGESALGEGRLNDEYATQMVKQAKIEGNFPDFYDAQGASSIYPLGSFYYFNGTFNEWLQKKYGMEKYAKFWYRCVNVQTISQGKAFKRIYGMKLRDAWKLYSEEYEVPDVASNPVVAGLATDFFVPEEKKFSSKNNAGALYTQMTASDKGIAYFDETNSKVFYIEFNQLNDEKNKPEKLFTMSGIFDMKLSKDGRYLALSSYDYASSNVRTKTKLYDMETGKFFKFSDHGFYEPSVIKSGNDYYVVRKGFVTPEYTINVSKLILDDSGKIKGVTDVAQKTLPLNIAPFNFTDLGDGTFAYIKKSGLVYSIVVCNTSLEEIKTYEAPKDRMTIRYISKADDKLLFSWTAPGTMPRLGSLSLATGSFELQEEDISGGVYFPIAIPSTGKVAYIGEFYRQNRMFTAEAPELSEIYNSIPAGEAEKIAGEEPDAAAEDIAATNQLTTAPIGIQPQATSIPSQKYSPFPYFTRGMFLPVSVLTTSSYSKEFYGSYALSDLGISYVTNDPWDSITLELDAGYGLLPQTGAIGLTAMGTNGSGSFNYKVQAGTEFNPNGWKKVSGYAEETYQYPAGNGWLVLQAASQINFGKTDKLTDNEDVLDLDIIVINKPGDAVSSDKSNYTFWASGLLFGYTNIRQFGMSKYEKGGFSLVGNAYYTLWNNATTGEVFKNAMDLEVYSKICIPKIIPVNCTSGVSYNLPATFLIDLFPSDLQSSLTSGIDTNWAAGIYGSSYPVASVNFTNLLFACDIQKSSLSRLLYFTDFQITSLYSGLIFEDNPSYTEWRFLHLPQYFAALGNNQMHYEDYAAIRVSLSFVPNIGRLASYSNSMTFFLEAGVTGIAGKHETEKAKITLGLGSSLF